MQIYAHRRYFIGQAAAGGIGCATTVIPSARKTCSLEGTPRQVKPVVLQITKAAAPKTSPEQQPR